VDCTFVISYSRILLLQAQAVQIRLEFTLNFDSKKKNENFDSKKKKNENLWTISEFTAVQTL